ncbi:MAG TPA: M15 family metallopeptidase [Stellaceae bacterium]|jgi:peptidoglycan hydrolase-like protein with peptidoglycan-binding domain
MLGNQDVGADVCLWQRFLIGRGFSLPSGADGDFGPETIRATRSFQSGQHIPANGVLDDETEAVAMRLGFVPQEAGARPLPTDPATRLRSFPSAPEDLASPTVEAQQHRFGPLEFRPAGDQANPERIVITNDFAAKIVNVTVPQLANLTGAPRSLSVPWHRLVVQQLKALWSAWENAGLLSRVKTFGGSFEPRFVRGEIGTLSNHAFGAAFDINFTWNQLGKVPALVGERGSVRELVPIANRLGFFWGGHFHSRLDGNHFEVARIMTETEVDEVLASPDIGV